MGIKNLMKIIRKYAPSAIKLKKINDYSGQTLAVDASLLIYKSIYAVRKNGYDINNNGISVTHIYMIIIKLLGFIKHNIKPIFVFDNKPNILKTHTIKQRDEITTKLSLKYKNATTLSDKKKYYYLKSGITFEEIEECKRLIILCGFPVVMSKEEADIECAYMSVKGFVNGIISDDTDILLFGGKTILTHFSIDKKKTIEEINLSDVLKSLKISHSQLIDLGILLGCDYCPPGNIQGKVGIFGAYEKIIKYKSVNKMNSEKVIEIVNLKSYNLAKKYFMKPPVIKLSKHMTEKKVVERDKLISYLKTFQFKEEFINKINHSLP